MMNRASDVPSPWEPAEFFELVKADVGTGKPQALHGGAKVALTLEEWRAFWKKHGQENDRNSVTCEGMKVDFDAKSHELRITMPIEPATVGATGEGRKIPGPFAGLRKGENLFKVWEGLPILGKGELP